MGWHIVYKSELFPHHYNVSIIIKERKFPTGGIPNTEIYSEDPIFHRSTNMKQVLCIFIACDSIAGISSNLRGRITNSGRYDIRNTNVLILHKIVFDDGDYSLASWISKAALRGLALESSLISNSINIPF